MTDTLPFVPFPKIPRLRRPITITEKIDGTNASVMVLEDGPDGSPGRVLAGSRTKWITPESDNYGFARWVADNTEELRKLGPGHHFGEWWGAGIQRRYGLTEKRFSLFNTDRWQNGVPTELVSVVPVLYRGNFEDKAINEALERLAKEGSLAAPGWMKPEGVVVFHYATHTMHKVLLEHDELPKGLVPNMRRWDGEKQLQAASVLPR